MAQTTLNPQKRNARKNKTSLERLLGRSTENDVARIIKNLDELDPLVREAIQQNLAPGEQIHTMIYAPSQRIIGDQQGIWRWLNFLFHWEITPDWVLVLTQKHLLLATLTEPGETPLIRSTPVDKILSIQRGSILLFSWLEWTWNNDGRLEQTKIYFNTVSRALFKELSSNLLCSFIDKHRTPTIPGDRNIKVLSDLPFKFQNIIPLHLLLPGEQIRAVLYRPSIWERNLGFLRKHTAAKMTLVLTNYHLSIAEEDLTFSEDTYGLIFTFCPLEHIRHAIVERQADLLHLHLTLNLENVEQNLSFPFQLSFEEPLTEFTREILITDA